MAASLGFEERAIRKIKSLDKFCPVRIREFQQSPSLFSQKGQIKTFKIPKSQPSIRFGFSTNLPSFPINSRIVTKPSPPEIANQRG
ncbi:hypothetical protein LguiA_017325 [Lonicera macranthoides]